MTRDRRHRVVVVGGGFGGLNVTRALRNAEVTVVDRTNYHLFQPLLYQVAAGILSPGLIAPALRSVIKKRRNARALLAEVRELDLARRIVHAKGPDGRAVDLPYDTLVVAAGATHSYFGHDEWAEFAPGMKTVEDARQVRDHLLSAFEMAELATDPQERAEWLTFLPGVAQPAIQQGNYVGKVIEARMAGAGRIASFRYVDKGSMATIGYRAAVADAFGLKVTGFPAYLMWAFIHMLYLIDWGNRLGTIYTWLRSLTFTRNRMQRIITFEQAHDQMLPARGQAGPAAIQSWARRGAPPAQPAADIAAPRPSTSSPG
jgi:NADH dehydrogenase FAD-containing subunit